MRGNRRVRERDSPHIGQANASFIISRGLNVYLTDGYTHAKISSHAIWRSQVLIQAQAEAAGDDSRVPTDFSVEQVKLWTAFTRMPRAFIAKSNLLMAVGTLEVCHLPLRA